MSKIAEVVEGGKIETVKKKREKRPEELGPVDIPLGKIVARRWKVMEKLGEGGCGAVFLVEDKSSNLKAALKAESNFVAGGSVLKLEVLILRRMTGRKYVAQLLASGKKEKYGYMVMTLFGPSLSRLFKHCKREFSTSTQVRLGMQILYGLKQLHEVGFVHRDVKPANLAVGLQGREARVVHLLDFGLSREFIIKHRNGNIEMRRPRENTLFRGTVKYCSVNSHSRGEQGRPDDLWSMVYILCEMVAPLPWNRCHDKKMIGNIKKDLTDEELWHKCPSQMHEITSHLRELDYFTRPDYLRIYSIFEDIMNSSNIKHSDPFDWELFQKPLGHGHGHGHNSKEKGKLRRKLSKIMSVSEDVSMQKTSAEQQPTVTKNDGTHEEKEGDDKAAPFAAEEFEKNELGF